VLCHHAARVTDYRSLDFDVVRALEENTNNQRKRRQLADACVLPYRLSKGPHFGGPPPLALCLVPPHKDCACCRMYASSACPHGRISRSGPQPARAPSAPRAALKPLIRTTGAIVHADPVAACVREIMTENYIEGHATVWEREPMERLAAEGQLSTFIMAFGSRWLRDKNHFENLGILVGHRGRFGHSE